MTRITKYDQLTHFGDPHGDAEAGNVFQLRAEQPKLHIGMINCQSEALQDSLTAVQKALADQEEADELARAERGANPEPHRNELLRLMVQAASSGLSSLYWALREMQPADVDIVRAQLRQLHDNAGNVLAQIERVYGRNWHPPKVRHEGTGDLWLLGGYLD